MFGCLRRIGCGALLIALGAWGYATKDRWWPEVRKRIPIKLPALRRPEITVDASRGQNIVTVRLAGPARRGAA